MKVFESVSEMFVELKKAKIVSLYEWKYMKYAVGWRLVPYEEFRAKLRGETKWYQKQLRIQERREENDKVLRIHQLGKYGKGKK